MPLFFQPSVKIQHVQLRSDQPGGIFMAAVPGWPGAGPVPGSQLLVAADLSVQLCFTSSLCSFSTALLCILLCVLLRAPKCSCAAGSAQG